MNTQLQKIETNSQSQELSLTPEMQNVIYQVAIKGDLKALTPQQKVQFIQAKCIAASIPLSRASECFEIIEFQGKEVLYQKKGLAEVIRDARNVRCEILSTHHDKDTCLYSVKAKATLPNGRVEESIATLTTEVEEVIWEKGNDGKNYKKSTGKFKPLRGQELANLIMKCETKAKRRVTLAICGLGMEERNFEATRSYDYDDIPVRHAVLGSNSDDIDDWNQDPEPQPATKQKISDRQVLRLKSIMSAEFDSETGLGYPLPRWTNEQAKDYTFNKYGVHSAKDITTDVYDEICKYFATHAGHFSNAAGIVEGEIK